MRGEVLVGGFVLVGGCSERLGRDKALLELEGKPLVLRAVELLRPHVAEVTLLGPPEGYAQFGLRVLSDQFPGRGPLAALCTGLENSAYEWNIFLACDLPLLEGRFVEFLRRRALRGGAEAVVPHTRAGWQPLCAAYHRACLPKMKQALEEGRGAIHEVLARLRVEALTADQLAAAGFDEEMFKNVNTEEDWLEVQQRMELRGK